MPIKKIKDEEDILNKMLLSGVVRMNCIVLGLMGDAGELMVVDGTLTLVCSSDGMLITIPSVGTTFGSVFTILCFMMSNPFVPKYRWLSKLH